MPPRRTPRSNVYRQLDPSINNNRGANPDANITLVRAHDDDPTTVTVFFDQPLIATGAPIGPPDWTANGHAFASFGELAPDGDSLEVTFAGDVSFGDDYDFPITPGGIPYTTALSGGINSSSGTVADSQTPAQSFDLATVTALTTHQVICTFDAPTCVPITAFDNVVPGFAVASATNFIFVSPSDDTPDRSVLLSSVTAAVTSGAAWRLTSAGQRAFVSLTGAQLNATTGTVA
jgi:hypothetical protein